jgi:hypothetical protein
VAGLLKDNDANLPDLATHWCAMFNEVFEIAREMLNLNYATYVAHKVSDL